MTSQGRKLASALLQGRAVLSAGGLLVDQQLCELLDPVLHLLT